MKIKALALLLFISKLAFTQTPEPCQSYSLSREEQLAWLNKLSQQEKEKQWPAIADRYFKVQSCADSALAILTSSHPLLVLNGVPYLPRLNHFKYNQQVREIVKPAFIEEIKVITKEPEGLLICAPFKGVILVTTDKKSARQLRRLKMPRNY